MNPSRRSSSFGSISVASVAALTSILVGCNDDKPVVGIPVEAGAGGTDGAAGSGGTGGADAAAGSGGTDASAAGADGAAGAPEGGGLVQVTMTALTSDQAGAANTDAKLINPWGLAINPVATGGPFFWVANNGSGTATVYDKTGKAQAVTVEIPAAGDAGAKGKPTGQVFNDSATAFMGDSFIFATEEGAIAGWRSGTGTAAAIRIDNSATEAIYKGLTIIETSGARGLAAADFHNNKVDTFSSSYSKAQVPGAFKDPTVPADFAPFNVVFLDFKVYVSYAKQDADKEDDVTGAGLGYITIFEPDGTFSDRLVTKGPLNAPWAMASAPQSFGALAGTLLVGNFGDGKINAFDKITGAHRGELTDSSGKPLVIEGLWALVPGPEGDAADLSDTLYFTAGPNDEAHGVFGSIKAK